MRVNGKWLLCDDGVIRPVVPGFVRAAGGQLVEVTFLLDAGADRTVFSANFYDLLRSLETRSNERVLLSGVGGQAGSITVETVSTKSRPRRETLNSKPGPDLNK